ncbi:hypothetical protein KTJ87_17135 [Rhodobacteraceae bacterium ASV31]|nr:hypothetical protein [Anianabacter salinae]
MGFNTELSVGKAEFSGVDYFNGVNDGVQYSGVFGWGAGARDVVLEAAWTSKRSLSRDQVYEMVGN